MLNSTQLIVAEPATGGGTALKVTGGTMTLKYSQNAAGVSGLTEGEDAVSIGVSGISATINASASDAYLVTQKAVYDYINEVLVALGVATASITATTTIPIGMIAPFATSQNTGGVPDKWLECDGTAVSRGTYQDLFTAIGIAYGGGDGTTTFNLPDLRGRVPIGASSATGTANVTGGARMTQRDVAERSGTETHQLTTAQMPGHTHDLSSNVDTTTASSLAGVYTFFAQGSGRSNTTSQAGSSTLGLGDAHNIMQPSLGVRYFIYSGVSTP